MAEKKPEIVERSKQFALRIIRLCEKLPQSPASRVIGYQLLRSGTSVGAQLREGKRSRSSAEMISKTGSALQELEETIYWLELLAESQIVKPERLQQIINEANEMMAILVTGSKTLKSRQPARPSRAR